MVLAAVLSMIRYAGDIEDRDFVDRMHSYYTTNILVAFSILVSFKQFGGKPVECLVPDIFSGSWEQFGGHPIHCLLPDPFFFIGAAQYAENYCWAQDTYFIPMGEVVDGMSRDLKRQRRISYYQWVPFFLLFEAACFRMPSLLWKCMAGQSGIKLHEIVKLSSDPNNIKPDIKKANIKSLAVHLQGALRFHKRLRKKQIRPHRYLRMFNISYTASFVTCTYLLTKFIYLCNVCVQLLIMNKFLETDRYSWYGFGAVLDLMNGTTWEQSGMFPRVSLCDFEVRVMGNIQEHTIQCVLVINIFNEKIFIFLWFWFMLLLLFTAGSLLYWVTVTVLPFPNRRFVARHLEMSEAPFDSSERQSEIRLFINSFMKCDGMFVIRMITLQAGVIFGTDLVFALWNSFFGIEPQIRRTSSFPGNTVVWTPPSRKKLENFDYGQADNVSNSKLFDGTTAGIKAFKSKVIDRENAPLIPAKAPDIQSMSFKTNVTDEEKNLVRRITHQQSMSSNLSSPKRSPNFPI